MVKDVFVEGSTVAVATRKELMNIIKRMPYHVLRKAAQEIAELTKVDQAGKLHSLADALSQWSVEDDSSNGRS